MLDRNVCEAVGIHQMRWCGGFEHVVERVRCGAQPWQVSKARGFVEKPQHILRDMVHRHPSELALHISKGGT